jgi:uncharacterized protein (DUF433 family)
MSEGRINANEKTASSRFQSAYLDGRPRIDGTRLSTEHVYQYCAGSDSDAHVKMFQKDWPYVTAKQIKQAIAFERKRRGIRRPSPVILNTE